MYEDRVLAFIDVLGFSEEIRQSIKKDEEDLDQTRRINTLIEQVQNDLDVNNNTSREVFKLTDEQITIINGSKVVNQFSDSIVISYSIKEESGIFFMLLKILHLCMTALQHNFLLRGSIVRNKLCHTRNKIFGPGLVEAYEMERGLAIYPRIVLDDDIIAVSRKYHGRQHDGDTEEEYVRSLVKRDFDGMYYINYFDAVETELDGTNEEMPIYLDKLREVIIKLNNSKSVSVRSKYLWLKEKYNDTLAKYKNDYRNEKANAPELHEYYKLKRKL